MLDLIPCRLAHNAVVHQIENALKFAHGIFRLYVIYTGNLRDDRNGRIVFADTVELTLQCAHIFTHLAALQRYAGIRGRVASYRRIKDQIDVVAVIILQDLIRHQTLFGKVYAAPLGQAVALHLHAVAKMRRQRLNLSLADDVVIENIIHDAADVVKHIAALHIGLIVLRGIGHIKIISAAAIVFCKDAVERKGDLGENIGADGTFRPCGVNFIGSNIFDVIGKRNGHIGRFLIGPAQMHRDGIRYDRIRHGSSFLAHIRLKGDGKNGFNAVVDGNGLLKRYIRGMIDRHRIFRAAAARCGGGLRIGSRQSG